MPSLPEAALLALGVSRETLPKLATYAALLRKWQRAINLVAPSTLATLETRHILDSAQLLPLIDAPQEKLADLGSGAGFPGLVLALCGLPDVHLVESDVRKSAFLAEVARETDTPITLHTARIETLPPLAATTVTARALAPLDRLLPWVARHGIPGGQALLPKGAQAEDELTAVAGSWTLQVTARPSRTDAAATILDIKDLRAL